MAYLLCKLNFTTPVHFGVSMGGNSLNDGQMVIHADTLFSALCCEGAKFGKLEQLVNYFAEDVLSISDTFPYNQEDLFLPKPVLFLTNNRQEGDPGLKKELKSLVYIPLSLFKDYLQGLKCAQPNLGRMKATFGQLTTVTKVAIKGQSTPLPYHVATWSFLPGCGLYLIVRSEDEEALDLLKELLATLGLSGIGGKTSTGLGKFTLETCPCPETLLSFLEDQAAEYQMLLGTALPEDAELEASLTGSWYTTIRRGGFIRSATYATGQLKKKTIYMLAPGSCFRHRFRGGIFDLADGGTHPVWRLGKTLFMGVRV
ncbi:MAG: type III-A CRISPR-associated RAMP protein Csm4 [Zhaonellaceae bacterium]|jgi:CRISPR-associated protein Csm4|nr:type III-A CRISPR-associated RAMP protein Csm4 [Clostridia bacterium]